MPTTEGPTTPAAELSVVIPAHNESAVIARLLTALLSGMRPGEFEVIVVANGCVDDTAAVARNVDPTIRVLDTPIAGKFAALRLADEVASAYPRVYIDADVVISGADVKTLAEELAAPGRHAAAPTRVMDLSGCGWVVRWYYAIWQLLPTVRNGLYGRGVLAVDATGQHRLASTGPVMGDDLAASLSFTPAEATITTRAQVVVRAPKTTDDLIRRRIRAATAVAQLNSHQPAAVDTHRTTRADLLGILRRSPLLAPKMLVFLAVTVVSRRRARSAIQSGDFTTWLRDESSRVAS